MFWFNKLAALICKGKRDSFLTALRTRVHLDYLMSVNRTTITSPKYSGPSGTFPNLSCKRRQYKKKVGEKKQNEMSESTCNGKGKQIASALQAFNCDFHACMAFHAVCFIY